MFLILILSYFYLLINSNYNLYFYFSPWTLTLPSSVSNTIKLLDKIGRATVGGCVLSLNNGNAVCSDVSMKSGTSLTSSVPVGETIVDKVIPAANLDPGTMWISRRRFPH